jgi:hypothetical protein
MNKLAAETIEAHGGLEKWRTFKTVKAHLIQGGGLWGLKGVDGVLADTSVTVDLTAERASHEPFGDASRKSLFTPGRVALLSTATGEVLEELVDPRASFAGHKLETQWTELQLAYFAGHAMFTYLNTPFLLAWPDVQSEEIGDWEEKGETWRRLRITYPDSIATTSKPQTLYIGADGLIRRHDYQVEISDNVPGAHYPGEYVEVQGIKFPTRRRIYTRDADGIANFEQMTVSIDLDDIQLS